MRRNRSAKFVRNLVRETSFSVDDLIYPVFILPGKNKLEPIKSMPGKKRYSVDMLLPIIGTLHKKGLNAIALFPVIGKEKKSKDAKEAFNPSAVGAGGIIGVLMIGFQRAAFSNEAGAGSASIAHSAVKTKYAASEGLVALLEPFIDTVVICTMTALVIITFNSTGAFVYGGDGMGGVLIDGVTYEGAGITQKAFAQYIPGSEIFLTIAVVLFAVSTMISWSYYGLQSWKFLFGRGKAADLTYKILFLVFVVIGAAASMNSIWAFSDAMIFAMVFPNMIGLFILFPKVKEELIKYVDVINSRK